MILILYGVRSNYTWKPKGRPKRLPVRHFWATCLVLLRTTKAQCLSKGACLQCVSRGASVRLQCLSKGACLQCVSRGASVRLQDGCSRLFWFAEDSGLFWSDGLTRSITECIYLYQDDSLDFILQRRGREGDYAPS